MLRVRSRWDLKKLVNCHLSNDDENLTIMSNMVEYSDLKSHLKTFYSPIFAVESPFFKNAKIIESLKVV